MNKMPRNGWSNNNETFISKAASPVRTTDSPPLVNKKIDRKRITRLMKNMYEARREYEVRWKQIRDYQLPYIGEFDNTPDKTNPGRRRDLKIAHGAAMYACQVFAAGVLSGLTPPSRQWFRFTFSDPELNKNIPAMRFLEQRYEIVRDTLASSNFYNAAHTCYMELPYGQAPLAIFADPVYGVRFQPQTVGTYCLAADGFNRIQYFCRKYEFTLQQIVDCFGIDSLNRNMRELYERSNDFNKKFTVCWMVEPNNDKLPGKIDGLNMPYRSMYWLENTPEDEFLYVGGFEEWALPTARYQVNGSEVYGKGPGWFAEGDSKELQIKKKDYLTALELTVKPPMQGPASLMNNGGINLVPGGMTAVDDMSQQRVQPIFNVNMDIGELKAGIEATVQDIYRSYNVDLFMMLQQRDNNRMTAREVMELTQEKLQQLGPVVERLQDEFLSLIIERVYNVLDRAGKFPPVPDELADLITGEKISIDYISPLAQAQKMSGLVNIEQGIAQIGQMAQIWPDVIKKLDPISTISEYFELLGMPAIAQRSDEEVQKMIEAEQEQMAQQQAMEQQAMAAQSVAPIADAAKNLTAAANDANPALTSWLGIPGGWE